MKWDYKEEDKKNILGGKIDPRPSEVIYGFLPRSLWYIGTKKGTLRIYMEDNLAKGTYAKKKGWKTPLSEMHPEVIERCVRYWSLKGDLVVDPFAGRGTRAAVCKSLERNYLGQDLSKEFYNHMVNKFKEQKTLRDVKIEEGDNYMKLTEDDISIEVRNGDSRELDVPDNTADMIISSPPYWNVEFYGKEEEQMYYCKTYENFLDEMFIIVKNCYNILREGRFCIWIVNDIRRDKKLLNYHGDSINLFKKAGFTFYDIIIYNLNTPAINNLTNCDRERYTIKSHEYILVFRKLK